MDPQTWLRQSLRYYWRTHLGVVLGAAVGIAVLVGALVVGDSVRYSLHKTALQRLGKTHHVVTGGDRFFRTELAEELAKELNTPTASLLVLPGTAKTTSGSTRRANNVQIIGMNPSFQYFMFSRGESQEIHPGVPEDVVVVNHALAETLQLEDNSEILLRIDKPEKLSRDAPLSSDEDLSVTLRLKVQELLPNDQSGNFSLRAEQIPPLNAFVSLSLLQKKLKQVGRANLLLIGETENNVDEALKKQWRLSDAGMETRLLPDGKTAELRTTRVFLDPSVSDKAKELPETKPLFTYFVNELQSGGVSTPYSMITAAGPPWVPEEMKDGEIAVTQWLADDLGIKAGDPVEVTYYLAGPMRELYEESEIFTVHSVVPLKGMYADKELLPLFPGISEAEHCRDWEAGFPLQLNKIRAKDEDYWSEHKGTPKAFIKLSKGQELWGNRFGSITAVRKTGTAESLAEAFRRKLTPASVGLNLIPVRSQAEAAVNQAMDFGGLFIGFSFFLIVAALLLTGLLFRFGVERRASEIGTLAAVGYSQKQIRELFLRETLVLITKATGLGVAFGLLYAWLMIKGLTSVWADAVASTSLEFHAGITTLLIGAVSGIALTFLVVWRSLNQILNNPLPQLLAGWTKDSATVNKLQTGKRTLVIGIVSFIGSVVLIILLGLNPQTAAGGFFGSGALLLIAGLCFSASFLIPKFQSEGSNYSVQDLVRRNAARRKGRSLAVIALAACGIFLVVSVGANRQGADVDAEKRSAGTGGFALMAETSIPLIHNINTDEGREALGLDDSIYKDVSFVPFRVRAGDSADCLNLNRAQTPKLLGVSPKDLHDRKAFSFAGSIAETKATWELLNLDTPDDSVPAIADMNTIMWALGSGLGKTIDCTDESGNTFKVKLVGSLKTSIMQGSLIISEDRFLKKYPSVSGYKLFLVDGPHEQKDLLAEKLNEDLGDFGMGAIPAAKRLAQFNAVQNTYLSTFMILGGLGVFLGVAGLGIVVLRNVLERRREMALLRAVGFRKNTLVRTVVTEHIFLLLIGLACGTVAAILAVIPAMTTGGEILSQSEKIPYGMLLWIVFAVFLNGTVWTFLAGKWALRGELLEALRNE